MDTSEQIIALEAMNLLRLADMLGLKVEITNEPLWPLAMGYTTPVVRVWPKRKPAEVARPPTIDPELRPSRTSVADRDWAKKIGGAA